jgi:hypothetical protein
LDRVSARASTPAACFAASHAEATVRVAVAMAEG